MIFRTHGVNHTLKIKISVKTKMPKLIIEILTKIEIGIIQSHRDLERLINLLIKN